MTVPLGMPFTDSEALEKFFLWTLMDPGLEHFLITQKRCSHSFMAGFLTVNQGYRAKLDPL